MESNDKLNKLEAAVLRWYIDAYRDDNLSEQIRAAKLSKRTHTGSGFYIDLDVPRNLAPIDLNTIMRHIQERTGKQITPSWPIDGPSLKSRDIDNAGDVLLWGENGYIDCIEMYAFGNFFNEDIAEFELGKEIGHLVRD